MKSMYPNGQIIFTTNGSNSPGDTGRDFLKPVPRMLVSKYCQSLKPKERQATESKSIETSLIPNGEIYNTFSSSR